MATAKHVRWDLEEQQSVYRGGTTWEPAWVRQESYGTRKAAMDAARELDGLAVTRIVRVEQIARRGYLVSRTVTVVTVI